VLGCCGDEHQGDPRIGDQLRRVHDHLIPEEEPLLSDPFLQPIPPSKLRGNR
jgi:hypothetical protein